jgi:ribosome-interacting GTPase 1
MGVVFLPANLTPQYYAAEEAYKKASTQEEKIEALQEMLAVIPKHKGTEKLQGDLKRRLSKLREEGQKKAKGSTFNPFYIEKQGAGQVVLIGYPNTGKSALVSAITRAQLKIAAYPFTTAVPAAGMMPYKDILIQLVDTPPITAEGAPAGLLSTIRNSDLLLIIADASSDECLEQVEETILFLQEKRVIQTISKPETEMETNDSNYLPYLIILTKMDLQQSKENLSILKELKPELLFLSVSINDEKQMEHLKESIFRALNIIRVYTKAPGKQPDMEKPFVLKKGDTVLELAYNIHRDFPEQLKNARVWGSAKFEGQTVARDYELQDGDIVELNV